MTSANQLDLSVPGIQAKLATFETVRVDAEFTSAGSLGEVVRVIVQCVVHMGARPAGAPMVEVESIVHKATGRHFDQEAMAHVWGHRPFRDRVVLAAYEGAIFARAQFGRARRCP